MLDGFGLHSLIWNLADQVVSGVFVASPMDARGRGIVDASIMLFLGGVLSIDLNSYATRQYVDNAVPLLSGYATQNWVGGNGTAWSSSNVSYTYMRIDKAGEPGYLTTA